MNDRQQKIDILTGKIPGTYTRIVDKSNPTQQYIDQELLTREEFQQKYSPFYNPELRMTLDEIIKMEKADILQFKKNEIKRKAELIAKRSQITC